MPLLSKDVWQNGTNDSQQSFLQFYIYLCLPMRPWGSWRLQPECHLLLCVCVCVCPVYHVSCTVWAPFARFVARAKQTNKVDVLLP